jgi:hypothetical protein
MAGFIPVTHVFLILKPVGFEDRQDVDARHIKREEVFRAFGRA